MLRRGGNVYAAEPLASGDFYALVSIVDNEDEVRDAAQRALEQRTPPGWRTSPPRSTSSRRWSAAWTCCAADDRGRPGACGACSTPVVTSSQRRFAELGEPADGGRRFTEIMRAVVLRNQ